jgi:hypothetical protein
LVRSISTTACAPKNTLLQLFQGFRSTMHVYTLDSEGSSNKEDQLPSIRHHSSSSFAKASIWHRRGVSCTNSMSHAPCQSIHTELLVHTPTAAEPLTDFEVLLSQWNAPVVDGTSSCPPEHRDSTIGNRLGTTCSDIRILHKLMWLWHVHDGTHRGSKSTLLNSWWIQYC